LATSFSKTIAAVALLSIIVRTVRLSGIRKVDS
jgi:hypothetical protein